MKGLQKAKEVFFGLVPPIEDWPLRCYHASFALYKGRIVSIGINSKRTHPINVRNRKHNREGVDISTQKFTCSEWSCLYALKRKTNIPFNKIMLINMRINRENKLDIAAPCMSCRSLTTFLGVENIWFTNKEGEFEKYEA